MAVDDRYELFAQNYVSNGKNGKKAAIDAGYSEKTAEAQASRLLRNVKVSEIIQRLQSEASERSGITVDWYINELKRNSELAREHKQVSASNGALKQIAEAVGLVPGDGDDSGNKQPIINIYPASAK